MTRNRFRLRPRLQRGELERGLLLFAYLLLVMSAYAVGRVARDALFLGRFPASRLPYADLTQFVVVALVVAVYVRIGGRSGLDRLLAGTLVAFGLMGLAFAVLAREAEPLWLYPVVYVWVGLFGVLAPAQVWTLASWMLTPREARRLFGLVGAGATLGAAVGGLLSHTLARRFGAESLLVVMSLLLLAATPLVGRLWRLRPTGVAAKASGPVPSRGSLRASLELVVGSPHLRAIAAIVLISSLVTSLTGWQLRAIAQQAIPGEDALAAFLGGLQAWFGVSCLATQLLLTAGILRRLGLGPVLLLLPLGLLFGSLGLLAYGTLAAVVVLRGADSVLRYSIDRPAVELLYLPVAPAAKLPAKSFIDTVVWRAGDGFAGLAVLGLVGVAGVRPATLSWLCIPLIGLWLLLGHRVHRRYIGELEQTLLQHRLDTERTDTPVIDRDTSDVLASRLGTADPGEILYALDVMALGRGTAPVHPALRGLLAHPEPAVRLRALRILNEAGDRSALRQAEPLLDDPDLEVRTEALLYLSGHSETDPLVRLGELGDFPEFSVRAALVAALARLGGERLEAAQPVFALMVAEAGEAGRRTRLEAARLAERMPLPFEQELRQLVTDEDDEVAATAIRAVARHGSAPFVDALASRLATPALAAVAADALAAAGPPCVPPLARLLADPAGPAAARRAAAVVLGRVGGERAAAALEEQLLDGDATLRLRVLGALCTIRERQADAPLDTVALEAALGAEILGHYRSYQVLGSIGSDDPDRAPIAGALRTAMNEELERVFRLLDLMHPQRDFRAAWLALQSGNRVIHDQALDLLESLLKPGMKTLLVPLVDPEVSEAVRERLAERLVGSTVDGPEGAVRALIGTGDPWLRSCAAYAIGALELRALEPQLVAWQDDPDPLLRETVRQARVRLEDTRPAV